jgi:hypothetical protein
MSAPQSDVFAAAKRTVAIEDLAGRVTRLRRAGRELRGACPLCGAGAKSASPPFSVKPDKGTFRCYGCDERGDVIELACQLDGLSALEAARKLAGGGYEASARPFVAAKTPEGPSSAQKIGEEMWASARPFRDSLAERYLLGRGLSRRVLDVAGFSLRYHPFAKWGWDEAARDWIKAPAMLVQVITQAGPTGGVHATYLARDGLGKADLAPAKRMWGPQTDGEGRPGGAWLIGPGDAAWAGTDLAVGEGIESTLSMVELGLRTGPMMRAAAALSLNRLQGGLIRDDDGLVDVWDPQRDPERPAFTWPEPPDAPWGRVLIGCDRDMSPIRVKGRTGRGRPQTFMLDSEARARLCARLAVSAWRAAGAARVAAVAPPPLTDFNDELRGRGQ